MNAILKNSLVYDVGDSLIIYSENKMYTYLNNRLIQLDTPMKITKFDVNNKGQILLYDTTKDSFCIGKYDGSWNRYQLSNKTIESIILTNESIVYMVLKDDNDNYSFKLMNFSTNTPSTGDWKPYIKEKAEIEYVDGVIEVKQRLMNKVIKFDENETMSLNILIHYSMINDDYKMKSIILYSNLIENVLLTEDDYDKLMSGVELSKIVSVEKRPIITPYNPLHINNEVSQFDPNDVPSITRDVDPFEAPKYFNEGQKLY